MIKPLMSLLGIALFSNIVWAQPTFITVKMAEETTIPGYTPPNLSQSIDNSPEEESSVVKIPNRILQDPKTSALWQAYFNKLRTCTPGVYVLPQINPAISKQYGDIETDHVVGVGTDNRCHITMMYYAANDPRLSPNPLLGAAPKQYPAGSECSLTTATIEAMIAFDQNILQGNEIKIAAEDPFSKVISQYCAPFVIIQGQKMMTNQE